MLTSKIKCTHSLEQIWAGAKEPNPCHWENTSAVLTYIRTHMKHVWCNMHLVLFTYSIYILSWSRYFHSGKPHSPKLSKWRPLHVTRVDVLLGSKASNYSGTIDTRLDLCKLLKSSICLWLFTIIRYKRDWIQWQIKVSWDSFMNSFFFLHLHLCIPWE